MEQQLSLPVLYRYDHSQLIGNLTFNDTPKIRQLLQLWADGDLTIGKTTAQYTLSPSLILDVSLVPVIHSEDDDDE